MTETVLDRIEAAVEAAAQHDPNAVTAPVALLWPDKARQWRAVVEALKHRLRFVELGEYDGVRRGPSYWIRCVVGGNDRA